MRTDEFDFLLPDSLIAQHPPAQRGGSRLLCVHDGVLEDAQFSQLLQKVGPGDLLVLNDTRVIKARLFGIKRSGGKIEVMVERVLNDHEVLAQVRASKSPVAGSYLLLAKGSPQSGGAPSDMPPAGIAEGLSAEVLGREGEFFHLRFCAEDPVLELLERYGKLPLPPYITHGAEEADEARYQTVFAREAGAVAAPTAGLHFDEAMLQALRGKGVNIAYVTLHVGAGTFQPVRVEFVSEHAMHSECYEIPQATVDAIKQARDAGGRVIAVGTTSLRALESAAQPPLLKPDGPPSHSTKASENDAQVAGYLPLAGRAQRGGRSQANESLRESQIIGELKAGAGETRIFITPGYKFRVVDVLLTNFHLPKSTLLMLVSAFGGMDEMRAAYRHAVEREYRFFSYGDAMLIERKN